MSHFVTNHARFLPRCSRSVLTVREDLQAAWKPLISRHMDSDHAGDPSPIRSRSAIEAALTGNVETDGDVIALSDLGD